MFFFCWLYIVCVYSLLFSRFLSLVGILVTYRKLSLYLLHDLRSNVDSEPLHQISSTEWKFGLAQSSSNNIPYLTGRRQRQEATTSPFYSLSTFLLPSLLYSTHHLSSPLLSIPTLLLRKLFGVNCVFHIVFTIQSTNGLKR